MAPSDSADRLPSRPALRDNRCLHLRRPIPAPASAGEHLKPLRTLTHRIVTRDYHRSSASLIAGARKVDAVSDQRKVGSAPRLPFTGWIRRVQLDEAGNAPALKTSVKVQEARQGSKSERISLAECLERWVPFLNDGGVLIDQAYQPQSSEGMVRCYVCGHRVVGFGHNLITALMTPTAIDTTSSTPQPMGRAMFGPEVTRFAALRKAMEDRWIPEMQRLLSIADHDLPLLWDADFLFRPGEAISDGSYALCEINASSVAPFPPSAVQPVAAAAIGRALAIRLTKETSNPH